MQNKYVCFEGHQEGVEYRTMDTYSPARTYTLPQPSTIIGMIHHLMGWAEYHPMKLSVQAVEGPKFSNLQTVYYFSNKKYMPSYVDEKGITHRGYHQYCVVNEDGEKTGITRGVAEKQLISEIDLKVYILPKKEEEVEEIKNVLENPQEYPSLGRHEDLINIQKVSVGVLERNDGTLQNKNLQYVGNDEDLIDYQEIENYPVSKSWKENKKLGIREFDRKKACVLKNLVSDNGYKDEKDNLVFLV